MFREIPLTENRKNNRKKLYSVGINDAPYITEIRVDGKRYTCRIYTMWKSVLQRVYSEKWKIKHPTYTGCTIQKEWLIFTNFSKWVKLHDWEHHDLDKDLKIKGNKHYSSDTCLFVLPAINKLLINSCKTRNGYPMGVSKACSKYGYTARVSLYGVDTHLGTFDTSEAAGEAFKTAKVKHVIEVALTQPTEICAALHRIADEILNDQYYGN